MRRKLYWICIITETTKIIGILNVRIVPIFLDFRFKEQGQKQTFILKWMAVSDRSNRIHFYSVPYLALSRPTTHRRDVSRQPRGRIRDRHIQIRTRKCNKEQSVLLEIVENLWRGLGSSIGVLFIKIYFIQK